MQKCTSGVPGPPGPPGKPGPRGDMGSTYEATPNWKQCAWYMTNSGSDNGQVWVSKVNRQFSN